MMEKAVTSVAVPDVEEMAGIEADPGTLVETETAPVENIPRSYPGVPLKRGSAGEDVYSLQRELNRIARNYPAIGTLSEDGIFGENTENAVKWLTSLAKEQ